MGIEKKNYTFRLEEELVQKLKEFAASQNRNLSNMVETILKNYVEQNKPEQK